MHVLPNGFCLSVGHDDAAEKVHGGDRYSLRIPSDEVALIHRICANCENTIVDIVGGSAYIIEEWKNEASAILHSFYSGMEGGNALADILTGKAVPSGHLPFTIAEDENDYPKFLFPGDKTRVIDYGYYHGYTLLDKEGKKPAFPFGFGLSYTNFKYSGLKLSASSINDTDTLKVSFKIKNTGDRDGAEIAELYVAQENSTVYRPAKELRGFKKVFLKAGEEKEVEIELSKRAFAFYDVDLGDWHVETDDYKILVGASSRDIRLEGSVKVKSTVDAPVKDLRDVMPAYYSADIMNVPDEQFEALIGHEIPESEIHDYPNLTFANTIEDSACGKNGAKLCKMLRKFVGSEGMACSIALQTPVKNFVSMSMGVFSEDLANQLLDILNDKKPMGRGILVLIAKAIPAVAKGLPNLLKNI